MEFFPQRKIRKKEKISRGRESIGIQAGNFGISSFVELYPTKSVTFHHISIIFLKASGFDLTVTWCRSMKAFPPFLPPPPLEVCLHSSQEKASLPFFSPPSLICYGNSISFAYLLPQLLTIHRSISRPYLRAHGILLSINALSKISNADCFLPPLCYFRLINNKTFVWRERIENGPIFKIFVLAYFKTFYSKESLLQ